MKVLNDGRPVFAGGPDDPIGRGPWARLLATSVVRDEGAPRAERGRILARSGHVHTVVVDVGQITGIVIGSGGLEYRVSLVADPVPPRIWSAVIGSTSGRTRFQAAAEGREQSVQLEHLMTVDWEEPLVPPARAIRCACTCPDADYSGTLQARHGARIRRRSRHRGGPTGPGRMAAATTYASAMACLHVPL